MNRSERERLFDALLQAQVPVAVLEGPHHTFTFANPAYEAMVGAENIVGKPVFEALPDVRGQGFEALLDGVKLRNEPLVLREKELRQEHYQSGEVRYLDITYAPLQGGDGIVATHVDVTEQVIARRASDAARERSEFLLSIATALGSGLERDVILRNLLETIVPVRTDFASLWTVDAQLRVRREAHVPFDAELSRMQGDAPRRLASRFPVQHVAETKQTLVVNDLEASMQVEGSPRFLAQTRRLALAHGLYLPIMRGSAVVGVLSVSRKQGRPFTADDEVLFASVATQTGIALENARLHAELAHLRDTAEAATDAKDRFLARVSHDLRNPLNAILGWSSLLKPGNATAPQLERGLEVIERSARAQVQLIEDLLDVSRIAEGKMRLELASEPVAPAIESALDAAKIAAANKGVVLSVDISPDVGSVVVDPARFRQVIWNLASNAVKFTPARGHVSVLARREGSFLVIEVKDTGRGIAPRFLPRLFVPFEQWQDDVVDRSGGLGLGLSIVRHIVELHGGAVTAESVGEGKGATFTVRLPVRAAHVDSVSSSRMSVPARPRALAGVDVLAVDDEADARDIVVAILEAAGADVRVASSVNEALALASERVPAVVVSDLNMPEKGGRDLIRQLRRQPETAGIPAVALTAMARSRDRVEAIAAGFNTHVAKPVDPEELVMMIVGLLARP